MARIRTIKPEFWGDEKLAPLSPVTRLTFLGLISMADDAGRVLDSEKRIDGFIFPLTAETCRGSLDELSAIGRIQRGETASGQRIIQITNWKAHQKIDKPNLRAALPKIQAFADASPTPPRHVVESVADTSTLHTNDLRSTTNDLRPTTIVPTRTKRESATWLTPASEAYTAVNGPGSFDFGKAARWLRPLVDAGHSPEKIGAHLAFYLDMRGDEMGYTKPPAKRGLSNWAPNLKVFRETFEKWNPHGAGEVAA